MLYLPETLIGILIVLGLLLLYLKNSPRRKAQKLELLKKYRRTQNLSMKLQDILSQYLLKHNNFEQEITPGITVGNYLSGLKEEHAKYLSEQHYLNARNSNSSRVCRKIKIMLEEQNKRLKLYNKDIIELNEKRPA